ncbi:Zinc finger protein 1 [Colletotrichum sp. SAR11_239]|nr:Zinc finger protein 1 [Colletotrichum sp. SAR11_239]
MNSSKPRRTLAGPIFRVRTGCLTCRGRKKKCDETKPRPQDRPAEAGRRIGDRAARERRICRRFCPVRGVSQHAGVSASPKQSTLTFFANGPEHIAISIVRVTERRVHGIESTAANASVSSKPE